ncbi:MAG: hypothetical protein LAO55_06735 [Acidobacteriia bacterium]|nr:hypothetical protein [Terriglobia bacterium]
MADFRRCLYALALVALLAGFTMTASAQSGFNCTQTTGVPPIVRAEGYTELMGDLVLDCTGGIPTPPNQTVPPVNIAVNLDVPVSSQVTQVLNQVEFLESLLIVDEPNSGTHPARRLLNCGRTEAPDGSQANAGVCTIIGGGSFGAQNSYDGTGFVNAANPGHPNVFQGRSFILITGQTNQVLFSGVPIDPPGTICPATNPSGDLATFVPGTCHRIIRITNIRGDASTKGVAAANQTQPITASFLINPASGLPVDIPDHVVARVQLGLVGPALNAPKLDFIQCTALDDSSQHQNLIYTFREGFENAFKPQSLTQVLLNGTAKPVYFYANGLTPVTTQGVLNNQNVPGTVYDTESGFTNGLAAAAGDVPTNPQTGGPPTGGAGNGIPFSNTGGAANLHAELAGIATQGTRLMITFTNIPAGSTVSVPNVVNLTNVIASGVTGVAVLITNTTSSGFGGTPTVSGGSTTVAGVVGGIATPNLAVYEVFFSNPNALEQMAVPLTVHGNPNLPSNLPAPNVVSQIQGSFAPFYAAAPNIRQTAWAAGVENTVLNPATLAIPRFQRTVGPVDFYAISRCSCNLLFPFVTNAPTTGGNFDTGIAIANTSKDPGNLSPTVYGFLASAQSGPVQLWYYNRNNAASPAEPGVTPPLPSGINTQCTNVTTPGSCVPPLSNVPAGGILLFTLAFGGSIPGATPAGPVLAPTPGFTGYMIAQTGFQYCHGFAYITKQGSTFTNDNNAMGYLAIVLDRPALPRTNSIGENDAH